MSLCNICQEAQYKYKCPTCRTPYCSVVCFKKHKGTHITTRKQLVQLGDPEDDEPSRLTPDDLQKLAYSDQVRDFLKDAHIRQLVKSIDQSQHPERDLDKARENVPMFDEFTKKLVEITFTEKLKHKERQDA
ncbi:hypothetical protein K501DRAFT_178768 [Backusella circina FSU 941]|nr:hypothetical protein K501DRAFT_178768 [Backusella circina FSU 941]